MATVATRLIEVNLQISNLISTGIKRYKTGLSEVEKALLSDLQNERAYLISLKNRYGLDYDEETEDKTEVTVNAISFV